MQMIRLKTAHATSDTPIGCHSSASCHRQGLLSDGADEEMKRFFNIQINSNLQIEFEEYVRYGGFPGALTYEKYEDKIAYISNIITDIYEKDIKANKKIKNSGTFKVIQNFIVNNFGTQFSATSIKKYFISLLKTQIIDYTLVLF